MPEIDSFGEKLKRNIAKVIVGKDEIIEKALAVLLSGGHVLINDVPGVGKTVFARSLAVSLGLDFRRIQCTPDLLPSDVTGLNVLDIKSNEFIFKKGPVFTEVLLVDEINRTTPRTQSALLEAMGERQVTIDGKTFFMARPFFVMATQNPVEFEGTFPLPEAQLDRFSISLSMGYPDEEYEVALLKGMLLEHPLESLKAVSSRDELLNIMKRVKETKVERSILEYVVAIVSKTRNHRDLSLGSSPRGSIAIVDAARALAGLRGRGFIIPDDVKEIAPEVLSHRIMLKPEARLMRRTARDVVEEILQTVPVPLENERIEV
ncbi:MAG TPA: MoxR family ATPase [Mesotoga infera]|jgi:MoxR-like ATPase|nr:MoxR family ATPase [Mesotoga infera]